MKLACVVALASTTAGASPLGVAWTQKVACPSPGPNTRYPDRMFVVANGIVWIEGKQLVRRARASGAAAGTVKLAHHSPDIRGVTGEAILVGDSDGFELRDAATLAVRWRVPEKLRGHETLEVALAGDDVVHLRAKHLELLDGKTGTRRWTAALRANPANVYWLGGSAGLVFAATRGKDEGSIAIAAYSAADGTLAWTHAEPSISMVGDLGWPVPHGLLYERENGLTRLDERDAAVGVELASPLVGAIDGGVAFVATNNEVAAVELAKLTVTWRVPVHDVLAKVVTANARSVYVADGDLLRELDRRTGAGISTYGIAEETVVGAPGTPGLLLCNGKRVVALDAASADVPAETTTISGKIACGGCEAPIALQIGDVTGHTDADGRFSLTVTGRGALTLQVGLPEGLTAARTFRFDGTKSHALGTIAIEPQPQGE